MEFNFRRFGLLLKRKCSMSIKEMTMYLSFMMIFCVAYPQLFGTKMSGLLGFGLFVGCSFGYLVLIARHSFREYKKTQGRIAAILVPASTLEKYVCEIVYTMVIIPILLYAGFFAGMCIDCAIAGSWDALSQMWDLITEEQVFGKSEFIFAVSGLAVVFAFFFGSLFFKKFSAAICICTSLLLLIVLTFRMSFLVIAAEDILYEAGNKFVQRDFFVTFGNVMSDYFAGLMCVMLVFFVVMTYLRLKEERA